MECFLITEVTKPFPCLREEGFREKRLETTQNAVSSVPDISVAPKELRASRASTGEGQSAGHVTRIRAMRHRVSEYLLSSLKRKSKPAHSRQLHSH